MATKKSAPAITSVSPSADEQVAVPKPKSRSKSKPAKTAAEVNDLAPGNDAASLSDETADSLLKLTPDAVPDEFARSERKPAIAPDKLWEGMSLFDYLSTCKPPLHQKIADISCSTRKVPPELRPDAVQDIFEMWSKIKPDIGRYSASQIASYASHMAKHSALHTRRELGSPVRLPGSAFRKRADGSTYVTPGVLAAALDFSELEGWMNMGEESEGGAAAPGFDSGLMQQGLSDEPADDTEEVTVKNRLAALTAIRSQLQDQHYLVMRRFIMGFSFDEIQKEFNLKRAGIMRITTHVTAQLCAYEKA